MKLNIPKKELQDTYLTETNLLQQTKTLSELNHTQENQEGQINNHLNFNRPKINVQNINVPNIQRLSECESVKSYEHISPTQYFANNNNNNKNRNQDNKSINADSQISQQDPYQDKIYDSPQYNSERNYSRGRHKRNFARQEQQLSKDLSLSSPYNEQQQDGLKISIFGQSNTLNIQPVLQNKKNTDLISQIQRQKENDIEQHSDTKGFESKNGIPIKRSRSPMLQQSNIQDSINKTSQNLLAVQSNQMQQKKLYFAEGDDYFFFDPKAKVKDLVNNQKVMESQNSSQDQIVKKSILKPYQKAASISESQKLKKQKSTSDYEELTIENNSKTNFIKSDSNIENTQLKNEDAAEQINSQNVLQKNARQRQAIFVHSDQNTESFINKNNFKQSNFNSKIRVLNDYEKDSYMRRASDINKLIQFQKKHQHKMVYQMRKYYKNIYNILSNLFSFQIFKGSYPTYFTMMQQAYFELNYFFLNISFIGILIFLYSIIQLYNHPTSLSTNKFLNEVFLNAQSGYIAYSGHLFLFLFILIIIKLSQSYQSYSLKPNKPFISLIFSEYRWNGYRKQVLGMVKKAQLIDEISENIENNEKLNQNQQFLLILLIEILILTTDFVVLYYILDDDQFLSTLNQFTSENTFLSSLIVSLFTSILMQANTLMILFIFSCFQQIEFHFFEEKKYFMIFFNQMFIIIMFQLKTIIYLDDQYNFCFTSSKIVEPLQISYLNFTLVISQLVIQALVQVFSLTYQKLLSVSYQREHKGQLKKHNISTIYPEVVPQISKQVIQENLELKQKIVIVEEIQNEIVSNKIENIHNGDVNQGNGAVKNEQFLRIIEKNTKACQQNETKEKEWMVSILTASWLFQRSIFLITTNYLVISNSILQPSIYVIALIINCLHLAVNQAVEDRKYQYVSLLNYIQFKSINELFCLNMLIFTFFFNFIVGLSVRPQDTSYSSLFADEFSYLFDIEKANSLLKFLTMPQLLFAIIIILSLLYIKEKNYHNNYQNYILNTYQSLKIQAQNKNYQE